MDKSAWPIANWALLEDELKRIKGEMTLYPKAILSNYKDRAIEILRQMIKETYYFDQDFGMLCFFCEKPKGKPHTNDCAYILAEQLLNEIDNNGRTTTEIT